MQRPAPLISIETVGPLQVIGADRRDCTPKGRKACGLLALLALAPNHRRPRAWLQDKLWSNRGPDQAAASLRQALSEVRRALGHTCDCLIADRFSVALDASKVAVKTAPPLRSRSGIAGADAPVLLEGLDINDPEFENWLRDQRSFFENSWDVSQAAWSGPAPPASLAPQDPLQLLIAPHHGSATHRERMLADCLTDVIAKTISEIGSVEILDARDAQPDEVYRVGRRGPQDSLEFRAEISEHDERKTWRLSLHSANDRKLVWSAGASFGGGPLDIDDPNLLRDINQIAEAVLSSFASSRNGSQDTRTATILCQQGIRQLFRLGRDNILLADRLFERAFELEPRGIYLAWRAYVRTYLLAELLSDDRQKITEEALAFMHRSLELEPRNSYVASFSAHVHAIARRSYVAAYELAERSIQLNRSNPMGWACLGIAECHLGKAKIGFEHTLHAREIVGATPFRFQISALACIAGSMAGDVDRSITLGEATHALAPSFKPPLRFLSALYLLRGQREQSEDMLAKLRALEPQFTYEMLLDKSYPAASLHRSKLLERLPVRQI